MRAYFTPYEGDEQTIRALLGGEACKVRWTQRKENNATDNFIDVD